MTERNEIDAALDAEEAEVRADASLRERAAKALPIIRSIHEGAKFALDTGPHDRRIYGRQLAAERYARICFLLSTGEAPRRGLDGWITREAAESALRFGNC